MKRMAHGGGGELPGREQGDSSRATRRAQARTRPPIAGERRICALVREYAYPLRAGGYPPCQCRPRGYAYPRRVPKEARGRSNGTIARRCCSSTAAGVTGDGLRVGRRPEAAGGPARRARARRRERQRAAEVGLVRPRLRRESGDRMPRGRRPSRSSGPGTEARGRDPQAERPLRGPAVPGARGRDLEPDQP
jgi:hypothetical protein